MGIVYRPHSSLLATIDEETRLAAEYADAAKEKIHEGGSGALCVALDHAETASRHAQKARTTAAKLLVEVKREDEARQVISDFVDGKPTHLNPSAPVDEKSATEETNHDNQND